jgi:cell division protein FtsB
MLDKIKKLPKTSLAETLSDVRTLGLLAFGVIALLVTWSGVKVVQTNYDLQKQISAMQQENEVRRLENSNIALRNRFLETDQYLELAVRKQFNKALPGEKLLIVPESVAIKNSVEVKSPETPSVPGNVEDEGPWYERNFNAWIDYIFKS